MTTEIEINGQAVPISWHPDLGWCLESNACAAGDPGKPREQNAYSAAQWREDEFGHEVYTDMSANSITDGWQHRVEAALASDGWWWRVLHPWQYGLPAEEPEEHMIDRRIRRIEREIAQLEEIGKHFRPMIWLSDTFALSMVPARCSVQVRPLTLAEARDMLKHDFTNAIRDKAAAAAVGILLFGEPLPARRRDVQLIGGDDYIVAIIDEDRIEWRSVTLH